MKKKNIFFTTLCLLCIVCSFVITSLYNNVHDTTSATLPESLQQNLTAFIFAKELEQNPDYEYISFEKGTSENIQKNIKKALNKAMQTSKNIFENDSNFHYTMNLDHKTTSKNFNTTIKKADTQYYINLDATSISNHIENLLNENSSNYYEYYGGVFYCNGKEYSGYKIHIPKDIVFTFYIPNILNYENGNDDLVQLLDVDTSLYSNFFAAAFLIPSVILILFIFINKYSYEKEAYIFQKIDHWLFEPAFLFWVLMDCALGSAAYLVSAYSIQGAFVNTLSRYHIHFSHAIVCASNILIWSTCLFFIALSVFWIKSQFKTNLKNWFFQKTLLGRILVYFSNFIERFITTDLSNPILKKYVQFSILIIAIILFLFFINIPFLSFVGITTLLIGFSILMYKKIKEIQAQYKDVLDTAKEISTGNFENVNPSNTGLFEELNHTMYQIKGSFEQAVKEQVQSQNMKTELIANVSHDLKTPLTGIKNYVELLNDTKLNEEDKKNYLERLNQYTDRLSVLITDLFEVSKANSGNMELECTNINIVEFIEQVCTENEELLEIKHLNLVTNLPDHAILLYLDGNKTYRIFENLFTNISKYSLENTRVFLNVEEFTDKVQITLKNTSKTPLEFKDDITERFVRGDKSRHEAGSGLGLAIVKSFTEIQNGTFKIETDGDLFKAILSFPYQKDCSE